MDKKRKIKNGGINEQNWKKEVIVATVFIWLCFTIVDMVYSDLNGDPVIRATFSWLSIVGVLIVFLLDILTSDDIIEEENKAIKREVRRIYGDNIIIDEIECLEREKTHVLKRVAVLLQKNREVVEKKLLAHLDNQTGNVLIKEIKLCKSKVGT